MNIFIKLIWWAIYLKHIYSSIVNYKNTDRLGLKTKVNIIWGLYFIHSSNAVIHSLFDLRTGIILFYIHTCFHT